MSHRTYRNPPIIEALCEFTFMPNEELTSTIPGVLGQEIRRDYDGDPRDANVQIVTTNPEKKSTTIQTELRTQFPTKDGTRFLSIGKNTLSVNVLKPYEGWTLFRPRIEQALRAYYAVAGKKVVTRVGVRYINRVIVAQPGATSSAYFNFILTEETALGAKLMNFVNRSEYLAEDQTKIIINHATIVPSVPGATEIILDIDTIMDGLRAETFDDILTAAETLHATEGRAFEAMITNKARELFDAE
jgi:uncharacterized protein (TIGR04255 family)